MKAKLLFFLFGTLIFCNSSFSQKKNFRTYTLNNNANYYDIINKKRKELTSFKGKTDRKSKKAIKQFERWAAFWKDRILPNGNFVTETHSYLELKKE